MRDPQYTAPNRLVYVIDGHPIVSFGMSEMIKDLVPQAKVVQFSSFREAVRHGGEGLPALIVTDFYLKDIQQSNFVSLFEDLFPDVPVMISSNDETVMAHLSRFKLDRFVVFSQYAPFTRLIDTLREGLRLAGLEVKVPRVDASTVKPSHAAHSNIGVGGNHKPLTKKQVEVLEFISAGLSNKEIADELDISAETVKGHVKDILERLQVKNRLEAAVFYRQALRQTNYVM